MSEAENTAPIENEENTATSIIREETKAEAFVRLANPRINSTLDKIRIIGNLSNRASYEYTENQVLRIEEALTKAVTETMAKFREKNTPTEFSL